MQTLGPICAGWVLLVVPNCGSASRLPSNQWFCYKEWGTKSYCLVVSKVAKVMYCNEWNLCRTAVRRRLHEIGLRCWISLTAFVQNSLQKMTLNPAHTLLYCQVCREPSQYWSWVGLATGGRWTVTNGPDTWVRPSLELATREVYFLWNEIVKLYFLLEKYNFIFLKNSCQFYWKTSCSKMRWCKKRLMVLNAINSKF